MNYNRYLNFSIENINNKKKLGYLSEEFRQKLNGLNCDRYTISPMTAFRPDLISYAFLGSEKLHWILTYINSIENSPEGYYVGRIIYIPKKGELMEIL